MDHQALKDIRMALLDGIAMMKQQIEQQNPVNVKMDLSHFG